MKNARVLVITHQDLVPPADKKLAKDERSECIWKTEYDVITTLQKMGHEVRTLGVYSDLKKIREAIEEFKPHVVYNLLEEFDGEAVFDSNVVSYLELLRVPYTGCNPRGLMLSRDKALAKKILRYHDIKSPSFEVFLKSRRYSSTDLKFPLIVKCLNEEASYGISQASVVNNEEQLKERVEYINTKLNTDAIAEEFIAGREFYVGVLGNMRLKTLPVWELKFKNVDNPDKAFYTNRAKFNEKYRKEKGIDTGVAKLSPELEKKVIETCKETYKALELNGYARIDLRIDNEDNIYIIEANPNPDIAADDEFALSAKHDKISYEELLDQILNCAKSWFAAD